MGTRLASMAALSRMAAADSSKNPDDAESEPSEEQNLDLDSGAGDKYESSCVDASGDDAGESLDLKTETSARHEGDTCDGCEEMGIETPSLAGLAPPRETTVNSRCMSGMGAGRGEV